MTCIVGLEHQDAVYIGADSAASAGWDIRETLMPKVFQRDAFLIGYTTSFRMGQLLWQHLEVRARHDDEDDVAYMICGFVEAVRECLKSHGYAKVDNNVEEGGRFLVGFGGQLFQVQADYSILRTADGFDAVGCGRSYALAAMKALSNMEPVERVRGALEIAAYFSNGVAGPFTVLKMPESE